MNISDFNKFWAALVGVALIFVGRYVTDEGLLEALGALLGTLGVVLFPNGRPFWQMSKPSLTTSAAEAIAQNTGTSPEHVKAMAGGTVGPGTGTMYALLLLLPLMGCGLQQGLTDAVDARTRTTVDQRCAVYRAVLDPNLRYLLDAVGLDILRGVLASGPARSVESVARIAVGLYCTAER